MKALILNIGSSSHKCRLFEIASGAPVAPPTPIWATDMTWNPATQTSILKITVEGRTITEHEHASSPSEELPRLLRELWDSPHAVIKSPEEIDVVGHRVVHGGSKFDQSTIITPETKEAIQEMSDLAPLHNRLNLEGIRCAEELFPTIPQIAAFDTSFHRHLPPVARIYPGPYEWYEEGYYRYGFHGISHQYCALRSSELVRKNVYEQRIISCHLGSGCSLAAILNGRSIDTTMGFTPLEGVMMGTRSGSIDPGLILYLQTKCNYPASHLEQILNEESGLKGISGISGDMQAIIAAMYEGHQRASLAFDLFTYRIALSIGSLFVALGGLDTLAFTGGIGEHASEVRKQVCQSLAILGVTIDQEKNRSTTSDQNISAPSSPIQTLVVQTQEEWEIARDCQRLLSK